MNDEPDREGGPSDTWLFGYLVGCEVSTLKPKCAPNIKCTFRRNACNLCQFKIFLVITKVCFFKKFPCSADIHILAHSFMG